MWKYKTTDDTLLLRRSIMTGRQSLDSCRFCRENGVIKLHFTSHTIRSCPFLNPHRCKNCGDFAHTVKYCGRNRYSFRETDYDDPRLPTPMIGHLFNQKRNKALEMLKNENVNSINTSERIMSERESGHSTHHQYEQAKESFGYRVFSKQTISDSSGSTQTFSLPSLRLTNFVFPFRCLFIV